MLLVAILLALAAGLARADGADAGIHDGTLDLRTPAAAQDTHELRGDWGFAWGQFVDPADDSAPRGIAHVPGNWNAVTADGKPAGSTDGFGSYTLRVACPVGDKLALVMPAQRTAYRLYVNGRLAAAQGEPATSAQQDRAAIGRRGVLTEAFACPLRIVVHLSNYEHRAGGLVRAPSVGPLDTLAPRFHQGLALDTILLGAYLMLGIAPVIFWLTRRKDAAPLFTGLFCLAQMVYADMTGERLLLQLAGPETPWQVYLSTEYLAWFASMALFPLMVERLFPRTVDPRAVRLMLALCGLGAMAVALTPARVFSEIVFTGQLLGAAMGLYIIVSLARIRRHGRADAGVLLAGMVFLLLVLAANLLQFYAGLPLRTLTAFGQLAFVLSAPMVLLRRLARSLTNEELRTTEQREKVDLLVRTTQAGILDWDYTRSLTRYSPRLLEILGHPADVDTDGPGWGSFFDHVHPDDRDVVLDAFRNQLRDRSMANAELRHEPHEYRMLRRDGSVVWVHAEAISIRGPDRRIKRYISSILDITEHRALAESLRRQNAALAENARLREDVERMSRHDLKTPLNSIIGVARLLREDAHLGAEQRELLAIGERAGYRLLEMVNLSLDLSRMELGTYDFRPQAVNLVDVAGRVLLDLQGLAEARQVQVKLAQAFSRPVYARAEELLTYSILANVVKNAIEATPAGGSVQIEIEIENGEPVRVRVRNPGRVPDGITERFFDKYVTAGKSGGLGLGTYSARLMARVQEGELEMATGADGTVLTLTLRPLGAEQLPAARTTGLSSTGAVAPVALADFAPRRVLVADDDEYNRLLLLRYLPSPPFVVDTAANGQAAVDAMARQWPDVALVDMEMPVMNGLETVAWIRAEERRAGRKRCLVLMMSSNDDALSVQRGLEAGSDRYLTKPFSREALLAVMHALDAGAVAARLPLPEPPRSPEQPPVASDAQVRVDAELKSEVPAFLESRRAMVGTMAEALARGEREQLRSVAHRAAGGLALFGFHWAAWQSRRISQHAREGEAADLHRQIGHLREHLDAVRVE